MSDLGWDECGTADDWTPRFKWHEPPSRTRFGGFWLADAMINGMYMDSWIRTNRTSKMIYKDIKDQVPGSI
jgi:hypothetical protein